MKYNDAKLQSILDWMQTMDPDGEWDTAIGEIEYGDLTYEAVGEIIKDAITSWRDNNGMSDAAAREILARLADARED